MNRSFLILVLAIATVGCGEDYSSGRRSLIENDDPAVFSDDFLQASQLHRARGLDVIDTRFERDQIVAGSLPTGYRTIPVMSTDDEGKHGINVRTRTGLGRPSGNCGINAGQNVTQRITDCNTINGDASNWNGTANGTQGESIWRLVAKLGTNEIWLDTRTGLIWSDVVDTTNWCNASGNKEVTANVNCTTSGNTQSCLNANLLTITNIKWRLPTRNDYLQADINGLRFVVREVFTSGYWTATLDSSSTERNQAWTYVQNQGTLDRASLTADRNVRCIGAAAL